jgi:hypothetical protein
VDGCWKKLWSEAIDDCRNFLNLHDKIASILMLTCEVPGEGFPDLEETNVQKVPNCYSAE